MKILKFKDLANMTNDEKIARLNKEGRNKNKIKKLLINHKKN